MLEVDNIMGLDFILLETVLISTMLDELPQTFRFVFINYIYSAAYWFFNARSFIGQIIPSVFFLKDNHLIGTIEYDGYFSIRKVHVAICLAVIDSKTVIVVYHISHIFIGTVRVKPEY